METKNAKIIRTMLGREDHGIFTAYMTLKYDGGSQSFGGYAFDEYIEEEDSRAGVVFGMQFIIDLLNALSVESWEGLVGTVCRVKCDQAKIHEIGHYMKDRWFNPGKLAKVLLADRAAEGVKGE